MAITLSGTTGITQPANNLAGASSGTVTLTGAANAGTWTFTMPTTPGTNGYVLSTDGTGTTTWVAQTGGGGGSYTRTTITATAGQTSFTAAYTVNYVQVYVNGVLLNDTDYTATSGTAIVLAAAASAGDLVDVVAFNISGFTGGVTITGTPSSGQLAAWTGASSIQGIAAPTTAGNVLFTADGSVWSSTQKIVRGTSVSASGTSVDFTSIPSWAKRITVMLNGVSTSGSSLIQVQIGSGSVTTSGYLSYGSVSGGTNAATGISSTTGFSNAGTNAANLHYGSFSIFAYSGNVYVASYFGGINFTGSSFGVVAGGAVTLGGTLDRVRLTTVNGTDTFDAGSVNILYE